MPRTSIRSSARAGGATAPHWPLLVLTAVAASTDALCYLGLDHVFPANMTGNTVLLAIGLTNHDLSAAARSALALAGFVIGAALTGLAGVERDDRGTRARRLWVVAVEASTLAASAASWLALPGPPTGAVRNALITLFGLAMGLQSGLVTALRVGISTTFITGTWTSVSRGLAARMRPAARRRPVAATEQDPQGLRVAVLCCYLAAALVAGFLYSAASTTR